MTRDQAPKTTSNRSGFTLVEMLVVVVILLVLMTAVGIAYSGGLHVWSRVRDYDQPKAEAMIALARLERDIRNMVTVSAFPFEGDDQQFSLHTLLPSHKPEDPEDERLLVPRMERVTYAMSSASGQWLRHSGYDKQNSGTTKEGVILVDGLKEFKVEYMTSPGDNRESSDWLYEWEPSGVIPLAVLIELTFDDDTQLSRVFFF